MLLKFPKLDYIPKKIISLVPSQTELLYHLGLESQVAGITKFCIHPDKWFKNKTRVGGTKKVNHPIIVGIDPDLVIANIEENTREDIEAISKKFPVWLTDVGNLDDAFKMITDIGKLTAHEKEAMTLTSQLKKLYPVFPVKNEKLPVAYLIWKEPYMTIGRDTFIDSMLATAGYDNVFGHLNRYPVITMEELNNSAAQIIFLSSEPYPFNEKHVQAMKLQTGKKVALVDGEMFSWYGSRLLFAPAYFKKLAGHIGSI